MFEIRDLTVWPEVDAALHPAVGGALRPNRALAERLGVTHRAAFVLRVSRSRLAQPPSHDQKLLNAIFGAGVTPPTELVAAGARVVRGTVLIEHPQQRVEFDRADAGDVETVERVTDGLSEDAEEEIVVTVAWPGPVTIGDALWSAGRRIGIVDGIVDDAVPEPRLYGAGAAHALIERRTPTAAQSLAGRSIGPYSIVNDRPRGGEVLRDEHVMWLAEHDGRALIGDVAAYRTGDLLRRTRVYEQLVNLAPIPDGWATCVPAPPSPTSPSSPSPLGDIFTFFEKPRDGLGVTQVLDRLLRPAGLALETHGHALAIRLRMPIGDDWSRGEVARPDTLDYDTGKPIDGGLFCQRLFGPTGDYECACGKHKRMAERGVVCESCGVEVARSRVRWERFAHVALAVPCIPGPLRPLADALLDGRLAALLEASETDGGVALRAGLAAVDVAARARAVPMLAAFAAADVAPATLLWDVLPVLPPGLRPMLPLEGGRYATSDLNDLYRAIINRNHRLRRLLELAAPSVILANERRQLRAAVDALLDNCAAEPASADDGRRLVSLAELVRDGLAPRQPRRCDYACSGIAVVDPALDRTCRVPFAMLAEVLAPVLYGICEQRGHVSTIKEAKRRLRVDEYVRREAVSMAIAHRGFLLASEAGPALAGVRVEIGDAPAFAIPVRVAAALGVRTGDRIVLHVPISDAAQREALALADGTARATPVSDTGWVRDVVDTEAAPLDRLVEHAIERAVDPCEWPLAALLIGGYELAGPPAPPVPLGEPFPAPPGPSTTDLARPVDTLELGVEVLGLLHRAKIATVGELVMHTDGELLKLGFRRKALKEVMERLAAANLRLGMPVSDTRPR